MFEVGILIKRVSKISNFSSKCLLYQPKYRKSRADGPSAFRKFFRIQRSSDQNLESNTPKYNLQRATERRLNGYFSENVLTSPFRLFFNPVAVCRRCFFFTDDGDTTLADVYHKRFGPDPRFGRRF